MSGRTIHIEVDADIIDARLAGREVGQALGLSGSDLTMLVTAISEVTRNILVYAGRGEVEVGIVEAGNRCGVRVVARDAGPGIADVENALTDGVSTGGGLGLGLPGARRLMDEFDIISKVGGGTTVTMTKWGAEGVTGAISS